MRRRSLVVFAVLSGLVVMHCGGDGGGLELSVDVRTDFAPGIEFDIVRTQLDTGASAEVGAINSAESAANFLRGRRVAEFAGLSGGEQRVEVSLVRARDGRVVANRTVIVALTTSTAVTVILARSCGAVTCPGSGDPPAATECEAGTCVTPECSPENPDACPTGTGCMVDGDCDGAALADCARRVCSDSVCFVERDDSVCEEGSFCDPAMGCIPIPMDGDAGMPSCIDGTPCDRGPCERGVTRCLDGESVCESAGPEAAGTECRPADGDCDAAEVCDGTSTECPTDAFADDATECRASAGPCDVAEQCNGTMPTCPSDAVRTAGFACADGGDDGFCDGLAPTCMTGCVPGADCSTGDACALGELDCSGASPVCEIVGNAPAGTECRASEGMCDIAETCSGSSPTCPANGFRDGTVCRAGSGSCGLDEVCDGANAGCPSDASRPNGTMCQPDDVGSWSGCAYDTTCDEDAANETRTTVSYACESGVCQSSVSMESRSCGRDTDGSACGGGFSCPPWSGISCNYPSFCSSSGSKSRTCTDQRCSAGGCSTDFVPQMTTTGCSRNQNGMSCGTCGNPVCQCQSASCQTVTTTVTADSDGGISFTCVGGASTCSTEMSSCSQTCPLGAPITLTCHDGAGNDNAVFLSTDGSLCTPCVRISPGGTVTCNETVTDMMDIDCGISERC